MSATDAKLLSVDQVAEAVGMCARTVRNAIERGDLRAIRFSKRCIRIRQTDFAQWIESHTTKNKQNMEAFA